MANRDTTITLLIRANAAQLNAALQGASNRTRAFAVDAESAGRRASANFDRTRGSVEAIGRQLSLAKTQLLAFVGIQGATAIVGGLARTADGYANLTAKIRLATDGQQAFAAAEAAVFEVAQHTSTSLDATATLFARISAALRDQGAEQSEVLDLTETVNQALAVSGATGAEAASAVLQLSQAFGAGALRGEEFNAVNEASPRLMQALADSLDVPRGALKALASEGKLTTDVLREAFSGEQARKIAAEFAQLPLTIGRSLTQLDNAFTRFIGQQDQVSGTSSAIANALAGLARNLDTLANVMGVVAAVAAGRLVAGLVAATAAKVRSAIEARALAVAELREAEAAEAAAVAQVARARALAASGYSLSQVTAAETALAAAQTRTAAATQAASFAVRGFNTVLGLLGGPLGIAITAITLLGTSFASARANADSATASFRGAIEAANRFRDSQDLDEGVRAGRDLASQRDQLRRELQSLQNLQAGGGGFHLNEGGSAGQLLFGDDLDAQIKRVSGALEDTRTRYQQVLDNVVRLRQAQATGTRTTEQSAKAAAEFNKTLAEQNEKLKVDRIEREKGVRAALEYRAMQEAGVKDVSQLSRATRDLIDVQVREQAAAKAATEATKAGAKATRDAAKARKDAKKDDDEAKKKADQRKLELDELVADANASLLRTRGEDAQARGLELDRQYKTALADLRKAGRSKDVATIELQIKTETARAQLEELQGQIDRIFGEQSRQEQSIEARQNAGLLTELGARRELLELHARTAEEVAKLIPRLETAARVTGDPAAIARVRDLTAQVGALRLQANELVLSLSRGFEQGLSSALEGIATGTLSIRDAVNALLQDVARSLAQLAAQQLAALATNKLLSLFGKGKTPDLQSPNPAEAAAAGTAYAAPIGAAAFALSASAAPLLAAATALSASAAQLAAAGAGGGGDDGGDGASNFGAWFKLASSIFGFAQGGLLRGPGTATSDSILMRGSDGEYVVRTAAVRHYGVGFMDLLNRMALPRFAAASPQIARAPQYRFAEGGLVQAGASGTAVNLRNINLFDLNDLAQAVFNHPGFERASLNVISSNPSKINRALA